MIDLKRVQAQYKLLNYGGKSLRHTIVSGSAKGLVLNKIAIQNLDLKIDKGTIYGLVGKNGSGKSTLLRVICNILPIVSGEVFVEGSISPIIGMNSFTDGNLTVKENLDFFSDLMDYSKNQKSEFRSKVLEFTNYSDDELLKPIKSFSHGMVSKLNFAIGIFNDNDIILMDEVLSVGDRNYVEKATQELKKRKNQGKIIVVVSHNLRLVNHLCDKVGIMNKGSIVFESTPEEALLFYKNNINH